MLAMTGLTSAGLVTLVGGAYAYTRGAKKSEKVPTASAASTAQVKDPVSAPSQAKFIPVPGRRPVQIGSGLNSQTTLLTHRGLALPRPVNPTAGYGPIENVIRIRKDQIAQTGAEKGPHQTRRPTRALRSIPSDNWARFDLNQIQAMTDNRWTIKEEFDDREYPYVRPSNPGLTLFRPVKRARGFYRGYRSEPRDEFQR